MVHKIFHARTCSKKKKGELGTGPVSYERARDRGAVLA